ncbi:MAG: hypothetical protein NC938_02060 [Candidatus Omnitrophica bacterium]|nr:hypothetical protein [Candidatus Omnitrophota bacterium]
MNSSVFFLAVFCLFLNLASGGLAEDSSSGSIITDIDVHIEDNNSYVIFYDNSGNECAASGSIIIYKTMLKFRDKVKMEGRGINQRFVTERVPYEEYGVAARQSFDQADFKHMQTKKGRKILALPIRLPDVRRGDAVKVVFGRIEKEVTAGY